MKLITPQNLRSIIRETLDELVQEGTIENVPRRRPTDAGDPRVSRISRQKLHHLVKEEFSRAILRSGVRLSEAADQTLDALVKAAEDASEGLKDRIPWDFAETATAAELEQLVSQYETASAAWQAVIDEIEKLDPDAKDKDLEAKYSSAFNKVDVYRELAGELEPDLKAAHDRESETAAGDEALAAAGMSRVTMQDLERVYRAAKSEYSSSYAMMIDDAMAGAENVAKKLGLGIYVDGGFFPLMFRYIKAHKQWNAIPDNVKRDMMEEAIKDQVWFAKNRAKKKAAR